MSGMKNINFKYLYRRTEQLLMVPETVWPEALNETNSGKELYRNYAVAKDIFDRADAVLGYSIKDICFQDEKKLGETEYAQPAILTMSIAAMKVLEEQGVRANMTA